VLTTMQRFIGILLLALACTAHAETVTGRVVGMLSGDTIDVLAAGCPAARSNGLLRLS
jgi:hypothetical protein